MSEHRFERLYFEDPEYPPGLKGGDEVTGYGYFPDYFPVVEAQLTALVEMTNAATLLDVGCGKGALAAYARASLGVRVLGLDASVYAIGHARRRLGSGGAIRGNCAQLPFQSAAFDVVWCNGVLQYQAAEAARAALAEIGRVARRAAFISNIAAAERQSDWGRRDDLTRLYLRPAQWAALARAAAPDWSVAALPFAGESAILLYERARGAEWDRRYAARSNELMRKLRHG